MVFPTNNRYCSYSCQRAHTPTVQVLSLLLGRSFVSQTDICVLMLQCNGGVNVYFTVISLQLDRQVQGKCKKEEKTENDFLFINMALTSNGKEDWGSVFREIRCAAQTNSKKKKKHKRRWWVEVWDRVRGRSDGSERRWNERHAENIWHFIFC